jgi:hypothetical protein
MLSAADQSEAKPDPTETVASNRRKLPPWDPTSGGFLLATLYGQQASQFLRFFMWPASPKNCWICGKPLAVDDRRFDEFGFRVHEHCFQQIQTDKLAPDRKPPKSTGR